MRTEVPGKTGRISFSHGLHKLDTNVSGDSQAQELVYTMRQHLMKVLVMVADGCHLNVASARALHVPISIWCFAHRFALAVKLMFEASLPLETNSLNVYADC